MLIVFIQVSLEFDLIIKKDGSMERFDRKWELWCPAVIEYTLATRNKSAALKHALRDIDGYFEGICMYYI